MILLMGVRGSILRTNGAAADVSRDGSNEICDLLVATKLGKVLNVAGQIRE
jgi:hypothetical protein